MNQSNQEMSPEYIFKFIMVGNQSTGKTSMLQYFIKQTLKKKQQSTVGVEFQSKLVEYKGKKIRLQIWDTAGQERYRSITRTYFKNTIGAVVVFDLTKYIPNLLFSKDSFEAVDDWINDARDNGKSDLDIIVVGNKLDLNSERQVEKADAEREMKNKDALYIETSAMTGENIDECFLALIEQICNKIDKGQIEKDEFSSQLKNPLKQQITNSKNNEQQQNKGCNC